MDNSTSIGPAVKVLIVVVIFGLWTSGCGASGSSDTGAGGPRNAATLIAERSDTTWDLVALGDSTPTGYGVGAENSYVNVYAGYISEDLGVEVVVHNRATNATRKVTRWVEVVRTDEELREELRNAEVVTIWMGWHDLIPSIGLARGGPCYPQVDIVDVDCFRSITDPMRQGFDDLLSEITSLANPNETLIFIADTGIPFVSQWLQDGTLDELKGPAYEEWRGHLIEAAENHGIHVVYTYQVINGPDGDQTLPPEYSLPDGLHFSVEGHQLIADLHRDIGYEYLVP